jgi:hypothetical protein
LREKISLKSWQEVPFSGDLAVKQADPMDEY